MSDANGALIQRVRNGDLGYDPITDADYLQKILGLSQHDIENRNREVGHGAVLGLPVVVTCMGEGEIMPFQSIATPGNRNLKLTGSLGDVFFFLPFLAKGLTF